MLLAAVGSAQPASFRIVRSDSAAVQALRPDHISTVQVKRDYAANVPATIDEWPVADTRASLRLGDAASSESARRFIAENYRGVPTSVASDMAQLVHLVAECALNEGGMSADHDADLMVHSRLLVKGCHEGPMCPRLHYDKVALRLACTYCGEGTRWLPQSAVNRAALRRLIRPTSTDPWLKRAFVQNTRLYNSVVRWPWQAERQADAGDILLMKGSGWRRGLPRRMRPSSAEEHGAARRALPVLHRSPDAQQLTPSSMAACRALFTVDYGGDDD